MTATRARPTSRVIRRDDPRHPIRHIDVSVVLFGLALSAIGLLSIYSSTRRALIEDGDDPMFYVKRQLVFLAVGLTVAAVVMLVDYKVLGDWAAAIYVGSVLSLVLVLVIGREVSGATSWFQLPGFQLQPSEGTKLALIVALAAYLSSVGPGMGFFAFTRGLVIAGVPMLLIIAQPDFGTTLILLAVVMGTFLCAGAKVRHIVLVTALAVVTVSGALYAGVVPDEQESRITAFLDDQAPAEYRYNVEQSEIAIGAGGLTGTGYLEGTQTSLDFVPEQHTDFIFTAVAEEWGFVGASIVLGLYALLSLRLWRMAALARDTFGTLVIMGILSMLVFQVFQNIGMTVGIMPITGIPLPFLTHGGSSTIALWASMGVALNVHSRRLL